MGITIKELKDAADFADSDYLEWADGSAILRKAKSRIEELEAQLSEVPELIENAFKTGLRYSINVKISDEHDVQTAWDWSRLKQDTLAAFDLDKESP